MPFSLETLKKRKDFTYAAQKGKKAIAKGIIVQAVPLNRGADDIQKNIRVGFTVTKKVGSAVVRNKIKRQMRALTRENLSKYASTDFYYVLIGRKAAITRNFSDLARDLKFCLHQTGTYKRSQKEST